MIGHEWLVVCLALAAVAACAAAAGSPSPRLTRLFDDGWRFHRGDVDQGWEADLDDAAWRRVDLPHDWSIEDLPATGEEPLPAIPVTEGEWRFAPGDDPAWREPSLDDFGWQVVQLPASWEAHSGYTEDNVYGWYRRRIDVPGDLRGREVILSVGKVDDVDETFVNGVKVGGLGEFPPGYQSAWDKPRRYRVPAGLLHGDGADLIAVRVFDGTGNGGLYATAPASIRSGPFDSEAVGGGAVGFTVGGVGWYRKVFTLPETMRGKQVTITFDGVYMDSQVWINGRKLGEHPYGYTAFSFDLTPHLRFGSLSNVIAVRVDASGKTSRWYPGSGIYRHVTLTVTDPVHVAQWGVSVTTPEVTAERATARAECRIANDRTQDAQVRVQWSVVGPEGSAVASAAAAGSVPGGGGIDLSADLSVPGPRLWSPDSPALYDLVTTVSTNGTPVDEVRTEFGIRTISVDAANGFLLNGKPIELRGGCVHHDNGPLGACAYDRAEERRVELLKASGFNAIRTAHNPPSSAFLDACDRVGMLVMDEAFDCWRQGKNPEDYHRFFDAWWKRDIESMVLRDRNHPSIVCWSIGNEIVEQGTPEGATAGAELAGYARSLDPTRPVAQAAHPGTDPWENMDTLFGELGLCGYNYKWEKYVPDHKSEPSRVIAGTESFPAQCFNSWMATADNSWVIGDFVWTSFDYLGEVALGHTHYEGEAPHYGSWPWTAANCGDIDICGFKRPQSYYRDAVWGTGREVSCFVRTPLPEGETGEVVYGWGWPNVQASWTWPVMDGRPLTVDVYSSCPQVRLTLNGRDLGTRETTRATRFTATYEVPYEPGELVAVGLDTSANEVARWALRTAGHPAAVRLTPDRATIKADGQDLCFVTVEILDSRGALNPMADDLVRLALTGPGTIVAVANSNPRSVESFQQPQRKAWRGKCLVVIRAATHPGTVSLTAEGEGLRPATCEVSAGG